VALSTLAVVTAMAVGETFRTAPPTPAVAGAVFIPQPPGDARESPPPPRRLEFPVRGFAHAPLRDTFDERRGIRRHGALDIMAPRGTPVVAVDDGRVAKLFRSLLGGITVYQFDRDERFIYYYAHLEGYADGLKEGATVKRGDVLGYVGTSGNAPRNTPHLHFTIFRAGPDKKWWKGTAVNPYPYLTGRG